MITENGVEKNLYGGEITVSITLAEEDRIRFCVEDDGCGMSKERLEQVLSGLAQEAKEDQNRGIGLSNIYGRLKLFYKEDCTFSIESEDGKGTKVIIEVPGLY